MLLVATTSHSHPTTTTPLLKLQEGLESMGIALKPPKCQRTSPQVAPTHHMEILAAMATHSKLKKPISRMTATYQLLQFLVDLLWSTEADHPTPLCNTCEQQEYDVCHTTGVQLACAICRVGKTGCSYSPFCKTHCAEMMWSGELPQAGSNKVEGKQVVVGKQAAVEENNGTEGNGSGKRKRRDEDEDCLDKARDVIAARGPVASPSSSSAGFRPQTGRDALCLMSGEVGVGDQSQAKLTPLARSNVPTIASLQSELTDLKRMVNNLVDSEQELWQENIMLWGWLEVLLALKDKMMVTMPVLEAEMRGIRNGMDLEKMKAKVEMLRKQLAQANSCLGHLEE